MLISLSFSALWPDFLNVNRYTSPLTTSKVKKKDAAKSLHIQCPYQIFVRCTIMFERVNFKVIKLLSSAGSLCINDHPNKNEDPYFDMAGRLS